MSSDLDYRARTTYAVGVDPGVSTGLSVLRGDGWLLHVAQGPASVVLDDLPQRLPFLCAPGVDVLVGCERYVQTGGRTVTTAQPAPQQVVGVVEYLAQLHQWELHLQAPADAKALVPNQLLHDLTLWTLPRDVGQRDANDANDATRHALTVLAHRRTSLFDLILTTFRVG